MALRETSCGNSVIVGKNMTEKFQDQPIKTNSDNNLEISVMHLYPQPNLLLYDVSLKSIEKFYSFTCLLLFIITEIIYVDKSFYSILCI